ncbi:helix-turn-helix transcriptional regulator [Bacillus mobilis]|uniref:Transcriptional regulator n=2 Tax=Bacillus cereus group TaxID=86661 RepID=A0A1C4C8S6_BACCE|nr:MULTISPECIES: helix-turn-helix transcriptional regulator [Bacillus cereus group]OKA34408.1 transcriptional regulator [Bacillus cereus]OKA38177.1 transcriptional regulator [Bacillus cereus]SCC15539.1 Transcriptional regulator Xre [Bacillus mobilis]
MLPILSVRVKELRKKLKLSQKVLGEKVGVTESFISKVESGIKQPSREVTSNLAEVLNCTNDYLLGKSDSPDLTADQDLQLTAEAQEILQIINDLPEDQRKKALEQLEMFVNYEKAKGNI